jgi:hypothetical protein
LAVPCDIEAVGLGRVEEAGGGVYVISGVGVVHLLVGCVGPFLILVMMVRRAFSLLHLGDAGHLVGCFYHLLGEVLFLF